MPCLPTRTVSRNIRFICGGKIAYQQTSHFCIRQTNKQTNKQKLVRFFVTASCGQRIFHSFTRRCLQPAKYLCLKYLTLFCYWQEGRWQTGCITFSRPHNVFIHPRVCITIRQNPCQNVKKITLKGWSRMVEISNIAVENIREPTVYLIIHMYINWIKFSIFRQVVGRDGSVGIATRYGLDGPGIESRWGWDFPHPSRPSLGPTQPPAQWVPGLSWG